MSFGGSLESHREAPPSYLPDGDPGRHGGGTYTSNSVEPTMEAYENIFGPSARDIKQDLQRFKRHGRWHLPDILKGPNQYLTDRVDGLITDAASSPFTSRILPYKYITNVDGKIKWNVWSFDEGLASRVPYESAARTLTQSKRSFAGYFIRQGMAIVLEHNFMMTEAGRENFRRQLNQLVGSIQLTNDLDVHMALVLAPSYQKTMNERYLTQDKSAPQICREFVELFGFVQKNQNALDILIEEAKGQLKTWGAPMPDFMLCNSKLTFQLTMTPDVTNYVTQGPEGQKKLKTGPSLSSYRGIGIVHTRAFSMETGAPPRDMLRRRVRVAEYYRITPHKDNHKRLFQLYNEERDTWATFTFQDLLQKALCDKGASAGAMRHGPGQDNNRKVERAAQVLAAPASGLLPAEPHLHLGEAMPSEQVHGTTTAMLTEFYRQIMMEKAQNDFCWEPKFLDDKIVFVPGSMDIKDKNVLIDGDVNAAMLQALPTYIRAGIEQYMASKGTGAAFSNNEKNRIKVAIQSVAPYHRNLTAYTFEQSIKSADGLVNVTIPIQNWAGFPAPSVLNTSIQTSASSKKLSQFNVYRKLLLRNYMRFGIPSGILSNLTNWGDPNTSLSQAIRISSSTLFQNVQFLDQNLRSMGAWFCPNHFKHPTKKFSYIGDLLGFHTLIKEELVNICHMRKYTWAQNKEQNMVHAGSYLQDIIMFPRNHTDLYKDVKKLLVDFNAPTKLGTKMTRTSISLDFEEKLRAEMIKHQGLFNQVNTYDKHSNVFWLFPRTEKTQDEVFSTAAREAWKKNLMALPIFQDVNDITLPVIQAIEADGTFDSTDPTSPKYAVQLPGVFPEVTDNDVANLFKMLAWRMWADQEIPLENVYSASSGVWPASLDDIIFPAMSSAPAVFGQGFMTYGDPAALAPPGVNPREALMSQETENIEVVIVRPNIEHYMMGIIMGQGGESLGSTFWGQTELSCYDDSMHGIWGMSYKYHERAIVINERNLIRLWDIAYDGYVGGKDDTSVNWNDDSERPNSRTSFIQATTDVTRPYRGPSMMVMAFHHKEAKNSAAGGMPGGSLFKEQYSSNWPSPIVFYDRLEADGAMSARADFDNLHAVDVAQFRVFNGDIYSNAYRPYKDRMPDFWELHTIRKNAGLAASENEVSSDALAFQGTMRVLSADSGAVIQEVLGSGHHGPDFIGVASLRAGKGYRLNSQPTVHRLV